MLACNRSSRPMMQKAVDKTSSLQINCCRPVMCLEERLCLYRIGAVRHPCLPKLGQHILRFTEQAYIRKDMHISGCDLWVDAIETGSGSSQTYLQSTVTNQVQLLCMVPAPVVPGDFTRHVSIGGCRQLKGRLPRAGAWASRAAAWEQAGVGQHIMAQPVFWVTWRPVSMRGANSLDEAGAMQHTLQRICPFRVPSISQCNRVDCPSGPCTWQTVRAVGLFKSRCCQGQHGKLTVSSDLELRPAGKGRLGQLPKENLNAAVRKLPRFMAGACNKLVCPSRLMVGRDQALHRPCTVHSISCFRSSPKSCQRAARPSRQLSGTCLLQGAAERKRLMCKLLQIVIC